jgi:hypothetical protein
VYAHETVKVERGNAATFLELVREAGVPALAGFGITLVGALRTSMRDDDECIVIWAIPTWKEWAHFEMASDAGALSDWITERRAASKHFERFLMADAPLAPMKIGRQPSRSDRIEGWSDL